MNRFGQITAVTLGEEEEARRIFTYWTYAEIADDTENERLHWNDAMRMEPAPRALFEYMADTWTEYRIRAHDPVGLQRAHQRRTSEVVASEVRERAEQLAQDLAPAKLTVRMAVAQTLFASDSAGLVAEGVEPGTWRTSLYDEQQDSYMTLAAGLVDSGVIAWPPAVPAAPLDAAAVATAARWLHDDIDITDWPTWADLPEYSRTDNRRYVEFLDAAGLLDHTAVAEAVSLELTEQED